MPGNRSFFIKSMPLIRIIDTVRTRDSGLTLIIPFLERIIKVDMREQVVDVPPQQVITKDNVAVEVDAVVYYEATDPVKLKYNVGSFILAVTKLAGDLIPVFNIIGASFGPICGAMAVGDTPAMLEPGVLRVGGSAPLVQGDDWVRFISRYFYTGAEEDEPQAEQ